MGKTIYIDDGDALNIDRVIVNMPNTKWCKVLYSCDLIDEYEARLKADKVAMLEELKKEIEELNFFEEEPINITQELMDEVKSWGYGVKDCKKLIQSRIDKLKENK